METAAISSSQLARAIVSVKKQIKYCITRRDDGIPPDALRIAYRKLYGLDIPTLELGYKSLYQLIEDTPEIKVTRDPNTGHPVLRVVQDNNKDQIVVSQPVPPKTNKALDDNNNNELGNPGAMGASLGHLIKQTLGEPQKGIVLPPTPGDLPSSKTADPKQVPVAVEAKEEPPRELLKPAKVLTGPKQPSVRAKKVGRATKMIVGGGKHKKLLRTVTTRVSGHSTRVAGIVSRKTSSAAAGGNAGVGNEVASNLATAAAKGKGSELVLASKGLLGSKFSKKMYALPSKIAKRKNTSLPAGVNKTGLMQPRNRSGNFHVKRSAPLGNAW